MTPRKIVNVLAGVVSVYFTAAAVVAAVAVIRAERRLHSWTDATGGAA